MLKGFSTAIDKFCNEDSMVFNLKAFFEMMVEMISPQLKLDADTCSIENWDFKKKFKKASIGNKNKWVSNEGPHGLCAQIDVSTLEHEGHGVRWKYTRQTTYVDDTDEFCKGREVGVLHKYSSGEHAFPINCRYISFWKMN